MKNNHSWLLQKEARTAKLTLFIDIAVHIELIVPGTVRYRTGVQALYTIYSTRRSDAGGDLAIDSSPIFK